MHNRRDSMKSEFVRKHHEEDAFKARKGAEQLETGQQKVSGQEQIVAANQSIGDEWSCPVCTLLNPMLNTKCNACGYRIFGSKNVAAQVDRPDCKSRSALPERITCDDWEAKPSMHSDGKRHVDEEIKECSVVEKASREVSVVEEGAANITKFINEGSERQNFSDGMDVAKPQIDRSQGTGYRFGGNLTLQERDILLVLAGSLVSFERSLESPLLELPVTLKEEPNYIKTYFREFTNAFERMYIATQTISMGPFKEQLVSMKKNMLTAVLNCMMCGSEKNGLPCLGTLSIFACLCSETQGGVLWVFQDFFMAANRYHYLTSYLSAAEQICLKADFSRYSESGNVLDVGKQEEEKEKQSTKLKKLFELVANQLQHIQLISVESLQPIQIKVMYDLAKLTKTVLRLWKKNRTVFEYLKQGSEDEKATFILRVLDVDKCAAGSKKRCKSESSGKKYSCRRSNSENQLQVFDEEVPKRECSNDK